MKNNIALLLGFLLAPPALWAAEDIGLRQALEHALGQAPEQALIEARGAEARTSRAQADSLLATPPALILTSQGGRERETAADYREWNVGIELPLWRSGQSDAQARLASSIEHQASQDRDLLRLELAGRLREAAWRVHRAAAAKDALGSARDDTLRALARLKRLVELGERPKADPLILEADLLDLEQHIESARAEHHLAIDAWRIESRQDQPPGSTPETPGERPLDQHPLLAQARLALERATAERQVGVLAARGQPTLGIQVRHEQPPGAPHLDALTASLSLPLPWESHHQSIEAALRYGESEASVRLTQTRQALSLQRQEAAIHLEASRNLARLAAQRAGLAREEARLAARRLDEGEMDIMDFATALRRAREAERDARLATLDVSRAIARHNQAQGMLP
ncbi:MAG: TolC family protein [Pseudomonadota bacterium]